MTERDDELDEAPAWLQDAVNRLRQPVPRSPRAVDTVVWAAVHALAETDRGGGVDEAARPASTPPKAGLWHWLTRPGLALSPLGAFAAIITVAVFTLLVMREPSRSLSVADAITAGPVRHQFVLVAPAAKSVSLVGDFNQWRIDATPLTRQGPVWTIEVALEPGRHVYSFVVDGQEWVADATAPHAPEDEFGRPNSVILVGRDT